MRLIEDFLKKVAILQGKYHKILFFLIVLITIFMLAGIPKIQVESDLSESMPQHLDIYQLNDKVTDKFGGQDVILILITLDDTHDFQDLPKKITNYKIINYINDLTASLQTQPEIVSVTSSALAFQNINNINQDTIELILQNSPQLNSFFSKDLKSTYILIRSDTGTGEKKVTQMTNLIQDKIDSFSKPPGTKVMITGTPPMQVTLLKILFEDATKTLLIAMLLIFILLILIEKSLVKTILIFVPLLIGLIWTLGTMGHIGLKISMATAGLGAMLLGLGVEYGVFMLTRFLEERKKGKNEIESLKVSVPAVGSAILGSGLTTTIGFLALTLSVLPLLQKLGLSLAIGIFFCLFSAVFISPIMIITLENLIKKIDKKLLCIFKKRNEGHKHGKC